MAQYLFNVPDGDREQVIARLRAKEWPIGDDERHRDALAAGDVALIYVAPPQRAFIGCVELATGVVPWTSSEAHRHPGDPPAGVLLAHVEEWDPPVPMEEAVRRIDPTGSNPLVQANAASGFRWGVVRITVDEYGAVLALVASRSS